MSLPITTKFGTQEVDCFSHLHGQFQPLTLDMLVTIIFLEMVKKWLTMSEKFTVVLEIKKYYWQQNSTVDTFYNSFGYIWIIWYSVTKKIEVNDQWKS